MPSIPLRHREDLNGYEQIISALWAQHGDAMLERLDRYRRLAAADPRCPVCQPELDDDDLPF
ncbi:MAG: hypothetical protein RMA76_05060 [Deltaproteobacteria bacterium]